MNQEHEELKARLSKGTFRQEARVLTGEELRWKEAYRGSVNVITYRGEGREAFFFTNDYCLGTHILHKNWVHGSMGFPTRVVPRPEFPDGMLYTIEDLMKLHHKDELHITSMDELVAYAIATNSYHSVEGEAASRQRYEESQNQWKFPAGEAL